MSERDAFAEGADAAIAGTSETTNPYDLSTDEADHMSWNDGYQSVGDEPEPDPVEDDDV